MVANPQNPTPMTEADYLVFEQDSPIKHEFAQGQVLAMSAASVRHNVICMNAGTSLNTQLASQNCIVSTSDTRLKILATNSYRYPDVMVICGDIAYVDQRVDTISNPIVIIEVLSPATALIDRNEKLDEYTQIDSLQEYILIAQDVLKVERFLRQESSNWLYTKVTGLDGILTLPSLGCQLSLADIYRKVSLEG